MRSFRRMPSDFWLGFGIAVAAGVGIALIKTEVGPLFEARSVLPFIGAGGCLLLGGCLAVQALITSGPAPETSTSGGTSEMAAGGIARFSLAIGVVVLHAALLKLLGLVVAGISLQVMLLYLVGVRKVWLIAALSLGSVGALYFGISVLLGVPLPESALW